MKRPSHRRVTSENQDQYLFSHAAVSIYQYYYSEFYVYLDLSFQVLNKIIFIHFLGETFPQNIYHKYLHGTNNLE